MFKEIRCKAIKSQIPIIKTHTEQFIKEQLNTYKPQNCVEIGSAVGYSSLVIANTIGQWGGVLTSFEVSYITYMQALKNFSTYKQYNTTIYNLDPLSLNLQKIFKQGKIDFLFIDAVMKFYLNFVLKFQDLLENDCIILLDNVVKFKSKTLSLYEFLEKNQIDYEIFSIPPNDGIMKIIWKKNYKNLIHQVF